MTAPSFVRSSALTYGTSLAVAGLSLANVLIISRALGVEGRGDVAFLTTVALVSATVSSLGVHQASANFAGTNPRLRPALATNALVFALVLGASAAAVIVFLVALVPAVGAGVSTWLLALALGSIPILILRMYLAYLVMADYGFAANNVSWLIGPVVNVVANGATILFADMTVGSAVTVWVVGQALGVAILAWYVRRHLAGYGAPDIGLAIRELRFGIKAHPGNVMLVGNYRLDQWLTGSISGSRELGFYSVAVSWGEGLFFLPTALAGVQRPDIVRSTPADAAAQASTVFRIAIVLTIPLALGLFFAAPFLCGTVFGEEFSAATDDLRLLVPGAFGIVALKLLGSALTAQGHPTLESLAIGVSFVATLVLDILLIPRFGGAGAALASSIAYCLGGAVVCVVFIRALGGSALDLVPTFREVGTLYRGSKALVRKMTSGGTVPGPNAQ